MPSFLDRLFRPTPTSSSAQDPGVLHRLMQACEDDPEAALAALQEEQALLARELEETFLAHDAKTRALAARLAALGDMSVSPEEIARLRAEQLELWRLVRRAQASSRATHELERELHEWRDRPMEVGIPSGHPDHPDTRMEIVRSELITRGHPVRSQIEASAFDLASLRSTSPRASGDTGPAWESSSEATILHEIQHREREIARLQALAKDHPDTVHEAELLAGEIRALQAHL